jgi:hypothetical protein
MSAERIKKTGVVHSIKRLDCGEINCLGDGCEAILQKLRDLKNPVSLDIHCKRTLIKSGLAEGYQRTGYGFAINEKGKQVQEKLIKEQKILRDLREGYEDVQTERASSRVKCSKLFYRII